MHGAGQGKNLRGGACEGENFAFACEIWDQLIFSTVFASSKKLFAKGRGKKKLGKIEGFQGAATWGFERQQQPPKFSTKWSFSNKSPRVAKGFQGPGGTPGMGEMSYNQIDHI